MVDHTQVLGTCFSCHDGNTATGKHPTHITSGDNCDDCHSTVGWIPANFDHVNITGNCISCHNGADATGKHPTHINTTDICEDCHNNVVAGGHGGSHPGARHLFLLP
jgi:predicted CXXCH cytochrome family protein